MGNGKLVCKGKDLLTECEVWSKKLRTQNVANGCRVKNSIKKAIWSKNQKDIEKLVVAMPNIQMIKREGLHKKDVPKRHKVLVRHEE